jgi:hypothetical protein
MLKKFVLGFREIRGLWTALFCALAFPAMVFGLMIALHVATKINAAQYSSEKPLDETIQIKMH